MTKAGLFSRIFHPITTTLLLAVAIVYSPYFTNIFLTFYAKKLILFLPVIFSLLFPMIFILIMRIFKITTSFELPGRNERISFLTLFCILQLMGLHLAGKMGLPVIYTLPLIVALANGIVLMILYFFTFPSLHAAGWSSLFFSLLAISLFYQIGLNLWLAFSAIAWGIASSARLTENRHTVNQIITGSLTGMLSILWIWYFG